MNPAIRSFLNHVPKENWILDSSGLAWLELDLQIPAESMLKESQLLFDRSVYHRSQDTFGNYTHQGWKSLTIYGESSTVTQQSKAEFSWTDVANYCPTTIGFIEQNWIINHTTGRIRFMWLEPGGFILPHCDRTKPGLFETNIALDHPPGCVFRFLDKGTVPFQNGKAIMVDVSNRHFVVNDSNRLRTHIIVHAKLKPGVIRQSYAKNFYS